MTLKRLSIGALFMVVLFAPSSFAEQKADPQSPATLKVQGLSIVYPGKNWKVTGKKGTSTTTLGAIGHDKTNYIEISFYPGAASPISVSDLEKCFWLDMGPEYATQMIYDKPALIGPSKNIASQSWMMTYLSAGPDSPQYRYYRQCVYFGKPGQVYLIGLHAWAKDFASVSADFEKIVDSVALARTNISSSGLWSFLPNPPADSDFHHAGGIGFYCPRRWTETKNKEESVLLYLTTKSKYYAEIYLTLDEDAASPSAAAKGDNGEARSQPKYKSLWEKSTSIGKETVAYDVCFSHVDESATIVERRVYFSAFHKVFRVSLECAKNEFDAFNRDFNILLNNGFFTKKP